MFRPRDSLPSPSPYSAKTRRLARNTKHVHQTSIACQLDHIHSWTDEVTTLTAALLLRDRDRDLMLHARTPNRQPSPDTTADRTFFDLHPSPDDRIHIHIHAHHHGHRPGRPN